jgi:hypothetical protein
MKQEATESSGFEVLDSTLMMKVFYGLAVLAVLSVAISFGGKWFGHTIAMAGYTDDVTTTRGRDRQRCHRSAGEHDPLRKVPTRRHCRPSRPLHALPEMDGYSEAARDGLQSISTVKSAWSSCRLEPRMMSRDMSGRLAPIYSALTVKPGVPGPEPARRCYGFTENQATSTRCWSVGFAQRRGPAFVARCLSGAECRGIAGTLRARRPRRQGSQPDLSDFPRSFPGRLAGAGPGGCRQGKCHLLHVTVTAARFLPARASADRPT